MYSITPYIINTSDNRRGNLFYILGKLFIGAVKHNSISFSYIVLNAQFTRIPSKCGICITIHAGIPGIPEIYMIHVDGNSCGEPFFIGVDNLNP